MHLHIEVTNNLTAVIDALGGYVDLILFQS
jgi:hypothetical protein